MPFFQELRKQGVPVSLTELLALLEGVSKGLVTYDVTGFYYLARTVMVKDEKHLDRFDRAFSLAFQGIDAISPQDIITALDLPTEWLEKLLEKTLSAQEKTQVQGLGDFDKLMQALKERLAEQKSRHQGGSKWIGTAGTSPFGANGYNPEGVRIGQDQSLHQRAIKVWDKREFRNLDDQVMLGTRNIKIALRRLRKWARDGAASELDMDETIRATAEQGWLDVVTRPEKRNAVKVLLFLDVGGSMDTYVKVMEELFSAARSEFKHLVPLYFHNCLYDAVWKDNARRWDAQTSMAEIFRSYGADYKCIFVGDASMSPYELLHPGGASEHWNEETGHAWLTRACAHWASHLWINPVPEAYWGHTQSIQIVREVFQGKMVPMTLEGIGRGIKAMR